VLSFVESEIELESVEEEKVNLVEGLIELEGELVRLETVEVNSMVDSSMDDFDIEADVAVWRLGIAVDGGVFNNEGGGW